MIKKQHLLIFTLILFLAGCVSNSTDPWSSRPYNVPAEQAPRTLSVPPSDPNQILTPAPMQNPAAVERAPLYDRYATAQTTQTQTQNAQTPQMQSATPAPGVSGTQAMPALPPVKIALLAPLSGKQADLGQALLQAAQIALFDMGYNNMEILPRDTKGTADGARHAAQEALSDGAQLILGPLFSDSVRAAQTVLRGRNINMIAFSTDWTLAGGNSYIMGFLPFAQVQRVIDYAARQGYHDFGILAPSTTYGSAVLAAYNNMATSYGLNTVDIAHYDSQTNDLALVTRQFARYDERKAAKDLLEEQRESGALDNMTEEEIAAMIPPVPFQAVLAPSGGSDARAVSNMLSYYDLPPEQIKRLGTGLWDDEGLATEESMNGAWFAAPDPAAREEFERRYRLIYGTKPPRLSTLAYDATALAAVMARNSYYQTGHVTFDRSALANPNGFAGLDGIFRFRPDGLVERGLAVLEINKRKIRVIEPAPQTFETNQR